MEANLVSIIITNFNYEKFVGEAIESAIKVDWPSVEIIVVDDGSTDGSRQVIEKYLASGVRVFFTSNGGHAAASEYGFNKSSGQLVMFLDADDKIDPTVIREAMAVVRPGVSKIQFQMQTIDGNGNLTGQVFPKFPANITPEKIRSGMIRCDVYPSPPNSGNIYTRDFLNKIFPLEKGMDRSVDSYCQATAPILGDVMTINKPLISYRVHGNNMGALSRLDIEKVANDLRRHVTRCNYATRIAKNHQISLSPDRWHYGFYNLAMRISSLRLAPGDHPIEGDHLLKFMRDWGVAVIIPQGLTPLRHLAMATWLFCVAVFPRFIVRSLVAWRFSPNSRPALLRHIIRKA